MITSVGTPVATACVTFAGAVLNMLVLLNVFTANPSQLAAINTAILAAFGVVAAFRAGAQHNGTLVQTAKPDVAAGL